MVISFRRILQMKKLLTIIFAVVTLLSAIVVLPACTNNSNSSNNNNPPQTQETWAIKYYVDNFDQPTDQAYITNTTYFIGTFSNSATTDSKLKVQFIIDESAIGIKLWEYGSQLVKCYTKRNYKITILEDNGKKTAITGILPKDGDRIYILDFTLLTLLQQNTSLSIHIEELSTYSYNSTYLFTVENDNFNSIYNQYQK